MQKEIIVIGCGVSGLTVANVLIKNGYKVRIKTKDAPFNSTSNVAGAVWFPYKSNPQKKVNEWSNVSYTKFLALSKEKGSGISMIKLSKFIRENSLKWWVEGVPLGVEIEIVKANNIYEEYKLDVPLIQTDMYLSFLLHDFISSGGKLEFEEINKIKIDYLLNEYIVINCTGIGAKKIFNDKEMYPIKGQIIYCQSNKNLKCIIDDDNPKGLAYIIPRNDYTLLGGTAEINNLESLIEIDTTNSIINRCFEISKDLTNTNLEIFDVKIGFRPGRTEVRIEIENNCNLIHNYGHGGSGYTLSWGCADDILKIVNKIHA